MGNAIMSFDVEHAFKVMLDLLLKSGMEVAVQRDRAERAETATLELRGHIATQGDRILALVNQNAKLFGNLKERDHQFGELKGTNSVLRVRIAIAEAKKTKRAPAKRPRR